jgi:translocator protein
MTSRRSLRAQALALLACIAAVFVTGAIGAIASMDAGSFYARLDRPDWAPPASAFGPVWTALYALMGVAAWLVWRRGGNRVALGLFAAQLAANALWSWLFFAWHLGGWAFADIVLLIALVVATTFAFARTSRLAALLLLPYLVWACFAAALSWTVWRANPGLL